jgi:hypothetical protein
MPDEDFPELFAKNAQAVGGETMLTMSQGLPAGFRSGPRHGNERSIEAPASAFWHEGRLNMGPAIWVTVALSVLGWAGVIGAAYLLRPLF